MIRQSWTSFPLEEVYDSFGRRERRLSDSEERILKLDEGDEHKVRDSKGQEFDAIWSDERACWCFVSDDPEDEGKLIGLHDVAEVLI